MKVLDSDSCDSVAFGWSFPIPPLVLGFGQIDPT